MIYRNGKFLIFIKKENFELFLSLKDIKKPRHGNRGCSFI